MARHAQPVELAKLKGADKIHPERYRKTPPRLEQVLGNAPDHLSEDAKAVWFEMQAYCLPGVMTAADRLLFEMTSTLYAEYRRDPEGFAIGKYGPLIGNLARFGLSPADRQKLGMATAEKSNPFDEF
jgi:phage terminase small subunit